MLEFFRSLRRGGALVYQLPSLAAAFLIAEAFYKFHSFSLECLAFLATWYALDLAVEFLRRRFTSGSAFRDGQ